MKNKQSMSLLTLSYLSTEFLYEIKNGSEYDDETKALSVRVLNSRGC